MKRSITGVASYGGLSVIVLLTIVLAGPKQLAGRERGMGQDEEPKLSLRSSPKIAFVPADILFVAELRGGADDYETLYCASVEWDWGDDTRSESTPDCDPYEVGSSKIQRRFSVRHKFEYAGRYQVRFHLKQRDDTVASARTTIVLRGGGRFR